MTFTIATDDGPVCRALSLFAGVAHATEYDRHAPALPDRPRPRDALLNRRRGRDEALLSPRLAEQTRDGLALLRRLETSTQA